MIINFKDYIKEQLNINVSISKKLFKELEKFRLENNIKLIKSFNYIIVGNEVPENVYVWLYNDDVYSGMQLKFDFGIDHTIIEKGLNQIDIEKIYYFVVELIKKYKLSILSVNVNFQYYKKDLPEKINEPIKTFYISVKIDGDEEIDMNFKYIYHLTFDKYINSIMKNGLIPTEKSPYMNIKYEYKKTYLTNNPFNDSEKHLLYNYILGMKKQKSPDIGNPILLKIKNDGLKLFLDKDALQLPEENVYNFWTTEIISPNLIERV